MTLLKAGDKAPHFEGLDQNGQPISLRDFQGKKLALYFYPKDDTPGCTAQACSLRDNYTALQKSGYAILGVSPDSPKSHTKFISKYQLPFPLLADTEHKAVTDYGVWAEKKMFGRPYMGVIRTTFIIDEKGVIAEVMTDIDTTEHAKQIQDSVLTTS